MRHIDPSHRGCNAIRPVRHPDTALDRVTPHGDYVTGTEHNIADGLRTNVRPEPSKAPQSGTGDVDTLQRCGATARG